ncbi:unnamed protein product [Symbiodinium necroappetens]|uniref:Uncharacterized protein n=1 Tax=Symbiodinium necroappetens TaxID=1628268 RepID=A0A812QE92_9DINO|nr:unnamed protein product [Symbiodinium necroappetens]
MLNVESWRRHTHGLCQEPVLINDQNVKKWIPDLPEEYFRMPAPAPKSDLIRYALLYHHGGLYMDADFVAVKDMDPILALLHTHDFVSYQEKGEPGQVCSAAFSSNLIGGRRGSPVFKFLWERQKEKLRKKCGHTNPGEACCPENARRQCTVPWAALGEGVTHPAFNELLKTGEIFETFCFADEWSFVPDHFAYSVEHIPSKDTAEGLENALNLVCMLREYASRSPICGGKKLFQDSLLRVYIYVYIYTHIHTHTLSLSIYIYIYIYTYIFPIKVVFLTNTGRLV